MLSQNDLSEIVRIGILLTTEKDHSKLISMILTKAMELTNCDAGTLYLYNNNALEFRIMKTKSLGISRGEDGDVIDLPPVPMKEESVSAYSAIHRELINIEDVYYNDRFDFTGPRSYDKLIGYRTKSMLVVPMVDMDDVVIGVMQLINSLDPKRSGEPFSEDIIVPFDVDMEFVLQSLGSQAAVAVSNMLYMEEVKRQMHSFVDAFAMAVDMRTPYNGSHTRKVASYAVMVADEINKMYREGKIDEYFDDNRREQLELAASVHDIGKMIVPLGVMNKATRLDDGLEKLEFRYRLLATYYELDHYKGKLTKEEYEEIENELKDILELIRDVNGRGFVDDDTMARIKEISVKKYTTEGGEVIPYLTEYEADCLMVRKGTLTDEERQQMESHVVMTKNILDKVHFNSHYRNVTKFAATHHEYLDGSGYPDHLTGEQLELESRILTVVDIYDALTSTDRPYKKPIPQPKAFAILHSMAEEGKIEDRIVCILEDALAEM